MAPILGIIAGPLLDMAGKIFDRVIPDKAAAEKAKLEFAAIAQSQEFQLALEQIKVNLEEAKHPSILIAGWRPFIGWICGFAFAYSYVLLPFLLYLTYMIGDAETVTQLAKLPKLELAEMLPVLFGMLGLGTMRSTEKIKGAEGNR
jgi:hypothetical protein